MDTTRIAFEAQGPEDAPAIVLLHALGADLGMWDRQVDALAGRYRVVRLDFRGHGDSSMTGPLASVSDYAQDAFAIMDRLGIRSACLGGSSLGGLVAMAAASMRPERVRSLVLANTALEIGDPVLWNERIADVAELGLEACSPAIVARWFGSRFAAERPDVVERMRRRLASMSRNGYIAGCLAVRDASFVDRIARIDNPTLVIAGADDLATPPSTSRAIADASRDARFVLVPEAGHFSSIETPAIFNAALLAFLEEDSTS